jgi:hypothetical protein
MLKPWDSGEQWFSACYLIFILVVRGNLQGIPSPRELQRKKRALLQGCESLVGTQKIWLAMEWERKGWEGAKVLNKKKKIWEPLLK